MVWLGTTKANVVSWSDTSVVATVAAGSTTGTAQVQRAGVWSNSTAFTVVSPTISSVAPLSGIVGTTVTITGSGFGATREARIKSQFGAGTTAQTVSPSRPLKIFWQPHYTPRQGFWGFGDGIDPANSGANIYNESDIFHEALHGFTGLYDTAIVGQRSLLSVLGLSLGNPSVTISNFVKDYILRSAGCPLFP